MTKENEKIEEEEVKNDEWEEITDNKEAINIKEEQEIIGILKEKVDSMFGGKNYIIEIDGEDKILYGKTALQKLNNVEDGTTIKVVYAGIKKSETTGRNYEDYKVFTK